MVKSIILIIVIGFAILFSGCTGTKDVTSAFEAIPEVQQFLSEHPTAQITMTYWSKEEVEKSANEISQQCDKNITPEAMYKATVSEGDLKIISWINADTQIVMCSVVQTPKRDPYTKTPMVSFTGINCANGIITIVHAGGDDIPLKDIRIEVNSMIYEPGSQSYDKIVTGDKLTLSPSDMSINGRILSLENLSGEIVPSSPTSITIIFIPNGQQLASFRIGCRVG